jgi:hypothetical protein
MTSSMKRRRRADAVANILLPRLAVDVAVPPAAIVARALRVSRPTAWAIVRSVLEENGVEVYRDSGFCRLVVRRMPETQKGPTEVGP